MHWVTNFDIPYHHLTLYFNHIVIVKSFDIHIFFQTVMYLAETNLPLSKKKLISNNAGVSLETMQAGI